MWLCPVWADLYYNSYNELSVGHWGGVGHNELASSDGTKHDRGWYQGKNGQGLNGSNRSICPHFWISSSQMPLPNSFWGLIFSYIFSGHLITLSQNYTIQPYILVNDVIVFYHENFHTKKAFWAPLFSHNLNYQCKQTVHTPEFISVTCHVPITSKLWNTTEKFWMMLIHTL